MDEMDIKTDALLSEVSLESQPYIFRREKQERLKLKEKQLILPCSYQFVNFTVELIGLSHGTGSQSITCCIKHPSQSREPQQYRADSAQR